MQSFVVGIFFPYIQIRIHTDLFYTIQSYNIKFSCRWIIFRRIAGSHNDPAFRYGMCAKSFVLEKLEHGRNQSFRNTVDLINKKDTFSVGSFFHVFVDGSNDFTHSVLCNRIFLILKDLVADHRKPYCTLAGMVGNSICYKSDATF